ncbi:phosphosulfolactate synthase [Arthrobacter castelli]|uniref:phosphosulfolactate synthase n=1 Tax=Arthrobacter castelli TaxID=271431 RepID=UPI001B7F848D
MFDVAGQWVDGVKWAGGSFALLPREQVRAFSDLAHEHEPGGPAGQAGAGGPVQFRRRLHRVGAGRGRQEGRG